MAGKFKKWECFLCGDIVVEGQRFAWIPEKGFAHMECFHEWLSNKFDGRIPAELEALLDFDEAVAYAIVRSKQAEAIAGEEVRGKIEEARHKLEGLSALAGRLLSDKLKEYGVEI